jgi:methyl coenzyme M reductase beta subunit
MQSRKAATLATWRNIRDVLACEPDLQSIEAQGIISEEIESIEEMEEDDDSTVMSMSFDKELVDVVESAAGLAHVEFIDE